MKLTHALSALPFIGVLVGIFFANHVEPYVLGLPFAGILVGIFFANGVEPYVLGLPFAMFWVVVWVVVAACLMAVVYHLDHRGERDR